MQMQKNPYPTVDIIIEFMGGIVLIKRKNPPHGWAIPGGFIDLGESAESAAIREAKEETGLDVRLKDLLGVYSSPGRDPRFHTISLVYTASATGTLASGDDAADASIFNRENLPTRLAFDHGNILLDYFNYIDKAERPKPEN